MNIQLPLKTYFHLDEIALRWQVSVRDLIDFSIDGQLELSTLVGSVDVEMVHVDQVDWDREQLERQCVFGLQPIYSRDLVDLVNVGVARVTRFKGPTRDHTMRFAPGENAVVLKPERLLVSRHELMRFEAVAAGLDPEPEAQAFEQRNNFSEVKFGGRVYRFGLAQAQVVAQLYEAAQTNDPWRRGHELLAGAKAKGPKLQDLFKRKIDPSWRDLILSNRRGLYRLALPAKSGWRGNAAYRKVVRAFRSGR